MDQTKVKAVEGRLLPKPNERGFVGYEECAADDKQLAHSIPGGLSYKRCGSVMVASTRYIRAALRRGDLDLAATAPKSKKGD